MKRLLVLAPRFPYPVIGGDRLRIYQVCKALSRDYKLTLLCLCENSIDLAANIPDDGVFSTIERIYLPRWHSWFNCFLALPTSTPLQVAYYRSDALLKRIIELAPKHDAVLAHLIRTAQPALAAKIPCFLEMTDAISLNYKRVSEQKNRHRMDIRTFIYWLEAARLVKFEQSVVEKFEATFLVSEVDRQFAFGKFPSLLKKVLVSSNGVNFTDLPYQFSEQGSDIVFIGSMNTLQNLDAAIHMAADIMPIVRKKIPEARLRLVGRIQREDRERLEHYAGVIVTGEVPDIAVAAANGAVGVCPVRMGAGVQNKILEYMSLGLPAVTTTLGFEGLGAQPGRDIRVADADESFACAVVELVNRRDLAAKQARNGRNYVENFHCWDETLRPLLDTVAEQLRGKFRSGVVDAGA